MSSATHRPKKTLADLAALPEGTWAELIDGEIYVTPSPSEPHQRAVIRLIVLLEAYAREGSADQCPALIGGFGGCGHFE